MVVSDRLGEIIGTRGSLQQVVVAFEEFLIFVLFTVDALHTLAPRRQRASREHDRRVHGQFWRKLGEYTYPDIHSRLISRDLFGSYAGRDALVVMTLSPVTCVL